MRALFVGLILAVAPLAGTNAQSLSPAYDEIIDSAITGYILPGLANFSEATDHLSVAARACGEDETALRSAYHGAFDAWMSVSHLRMGPSEENGAAFAIAFWPDPKGFTSKSLRTLIRSKDMAVADPSTFSEVSIASRGLFALERLLFGPAFAAPEDGYRCDLMQAIADDLAQLARGIEDGWRDTYADALRGISGPQAFGDSKQAVQALYATMKTGLEFTLTARFERPLGLDSRARPSRAEAWRSERSNRNIQLSLLTLETMFEDVFAAHIPEQAANIIRSEFYYVRRQTDTMPATLRTMVTEPLGRGKIITLRFSLVDMLEQMEGLLRPALGLSLSFNTLDGD
jgi:predicted lipoprotein